jgi:ssDNA-binding Zn-finger/Zn-ribbon topoisomerase 1
MTRRQEEGGFDRLVRFMSAQPHWGGPVIAALAYVFCRLILPAILRVSNGPPSHPGAHVFAVAVGTISIKLAPLVALLVLFVWLLAELAKWKNPRRLDRQPGLARTGNLPQSIPPAASPETTSPQTNSPEPTRTSPPEAAPSCPRCGSPMVQRTAKKGPNAGSRFWGCPGYPRCQGTRSID